MRSLYLINPRPHVANYDVAPGFITIPDLAILTVAAMAPPGWDVTVCEEEILDVDLDTPARFVGLTGKNAQLPRMIELADAFHARGKVVLVGGPLASLDPEALRPHADILVTGEMEDIAPRLFADLASGKWSTHYEGGRPDLRTSPVPRWDLYPVDRALMGALQTTRGCPFDCEFCDVIRYNGRKQRHKDADQILRELDALHAAGFRQVFLTDDNFTVHRQFARATLDALADWNGRHATDPMRFVTQASVDVARDEDILRRCAKAGLDHLFVGIETVNTASLRETNKRQNLLMPAHEAVQRIVSQGILVRNGLMVGFDHDGPDVFDTLFDFQQSAPLPIPTVNVLFAAKGTPLHDRMHRDGRLVERDSRWSENLFSNVVPKLMTYDALIEGARSLARRLFVPAAFEHRVMNFIAAFGTAAEGSAERPTPGRSAAGPRGTYALGCMRRIASRGEDEARMVSRVLAAGARKPGTLRSIITCLVFYDQYRAYLDDADRRRLVAA
ncbi:B12-binding domain-containing radical SAM protein [Lichenibacterium dinghuense]|uniref:B12-binding domain-containing radical SAM protein n=1 Tax=Lichenibacterium dinghuense TaxID=2895977 RepID=UPI001F0039B1|nr:radical SAM protein [Lichenibacterium sp. 6Y81]